MLYKFAKAIKHQSKWVKKSIINFHKKSIVKADLIIFDDIFPNPLSDWRTNEFNHYLNNFKDVKIITNIYGNKIKKQKFIDLEPLKFENKVSAVNFITSNINTKYDAKLGYCLFYNNLMKVFSTFENHKIPFVFTLYPGGGFKIYDERIEKNLKLVFNSPLFRHVIVNMPHVYNYLIDRFNLDPSKITYNYGAPLDFKVKNLKLKNRNNSKIKVVFCAHKYMNYGLDKGFDVFNRVAKYFEFDTRFEFSVIGGFRYHDLIFKVNNIKFISEVLPQNLEDLFMEFDIILSPNRSHVLYYGAFDGFPTGSVLHAANCFVMMMLTDDFDNSEQLNLVNGIDFVRISTNVSEIAERLNYLAMNPEKIIEIAQSGRNKILAALNLSNQLTVRTQILQSYL